MADPTLNRIAVSVLLTPRFDSDEVLLVRRSPELAFFGGYYAFPGGVLDPGDKEVPVRNLPPLPAGQERDYPWFVAAAARELFEETGVLPARGIERVEAEKLRRYRRSLLEDQLDFVEMMHRHQLHLDGRDFRPVCRALTPPFASRRYDTWFVCCRLPERATVDIWPGELTEGRFMRAGDALDGWRQGENLIVPPVIILLGELAGRGFEAFLERVRPLTEACAAGVLHRVYFTPGIQLAPLKTPTRPPATHTNCYVIGEERLFLVDPGTPDAHEQQRLWGLLDQLLSEGRTLEGILLTHDHPDHVGAVEEAGRRYRIPLFAHRETARALPHLAFDGEVGHGDEIDLGMTPDGSRDWKLHVYHVPGHAPGHLAFQESRYRSLVVGDLISTLSSILIDPADGHLATYLKSLEFLESVASGMVYPGHGPPAREGARAIGAALSHRRERERQLLAALGPEPGTVEDLVRRVYTDVESSLIPMAERSLLSGLIKLEEEGRVERSERGYRLRAAPGSPRPARTADTGSTA